MHIIEINKLRKSKQYFESTTDFPRNFMSAMSACKSSKGPSNKTVKVRETINVFLRSTKGVYKGANIFSLSSL